MRSRVFSLVVSFGVSCVTLLYRGLNYSHPIFCFLKKLIFTRLFRSLFCCWLFFLKTDWALSGCFLKASRVKLTSTHVVSVFCQQWPLVVGGHRFWQSYLEESVGWGLFEMPSLELDSIVLYLATAVESISFLTLFVFLLLILALKRAVFSCLRNMTQLNPPSRFLLVSNLKKSLN